ncbi:peptide chain release factor eRF/aRF, subunit 1 [Edhazardia aedis USNM 41457]|uniref:Peptide chain release factor eRF/aRF, subunit 1 n=1 Tax=Edhazardia aedis (strain USNM 41457) TaxID=1003232 RepID=J9DHW4_EDHAE|nr:peptide chain release factor eRF/aRF, subunit 1 [Edhazardia aedis USNM 41457]|eukprot:EJW02210.1 peptide chain release factor eRF/aRF, subunit 1 [Edhazardia aedis USNM 41457]
MDDIEVWRLKKLLKKLKDARGNGTSMISLIIPPKDQLSKISKMLTDEYGTASNIKSRVNRLSVLSAITSAQHKLKTYTKTPKNGLAIYVGTILENDKEKKVSVGIEPIKPINTSLYLCDSSFHVSDLLTLFENESKYAFVIIDGHQTLFATLQGNTKAILQVLNVDLPKKHGRGGQSSVRFARLRLERRLIYVKKVAEICGNLFLSEAIPNIDGLLLAGSSELKHEMREFLDQKLKDKVLKVVDTNYGGENGLNEAIDLCQDVLKEVKFSKEKIVINAFFDEMKNDTGKYCYGYKDTLHCLEMNAIETVVVYENCDVMHNEDELFIDWIAENYTQFACKLEVVSDKSEEGHQFVNGFGGIGGILRYKIDLIEHNQDYESIDDDDIF